MPFVDTYFLKYEVKADYPYSTHICDTEEDAKAVVRWERKVHNVGCTVRVVGEAVRFFGLNDDGPAELVGRYA